MAKRRSKTLKQQAKAYEVQSETEMMDIMIASYVYGHYVDFKDYFRALVVKERKRFLNYLYNNTEPYDFYKMVDMLMFD